MTPDTFESRGYRTTHDAALRRSSNYPFLFVNAGYTNPSEVVEWIHSQPIGVLNVAGNRESVMPGIDERVELFMRSVLRCLGRTEA